MEKIICASIKYRLIGDKEFKYVTGRSHADCINALSFMDLFSYKRDMNVEVQGFKTSEGRFVDRKEALHIAMIAGQIDKHYDHDVLYSEYLYK